MSNLFEERFITNRTSLGIVPGREAVKKCGPKLINFGLISWRKLMRMKMLEGGWAAHPVVTQLV